MPIAAPGALTRIVGTIDISIDSRIENLVPKNDGGPLIIADGFHRMCLLFSIDQEVSVPCKIG